MQMSLKMFLLAEDLWPCSLQGRGWQHLLLSSDSLYSALLRKSLLPPSRYAGFLLGVTNTFGIIAGIIAPTAVGLLVSQVIWGHKPQAYSWKKAQLCSQKQIAFFALNQNLVPASPLTTHACHVAPCKPEPPFWGCGDESGRWKSPTWPHLGVLRDGEG